MYGASGEKKPFLKTLWEKTKMLVTSIFVFFHIDFYPIKEKKRNVSATIKLSSANTLNLDNAKTLSSGNGLKL